MLRFNIVLVFLLVFIAFLISCFIKHIKHFFGKNSIEINEINLGIGTNSSIKLKYNSKEKDIAYKLWVEISTRKIGLKFDEENDVITEVYDSWYEFFKIARELMKEIPVNNSSNVIRLTDLTEKVLNQGLRPHLTKWQARYRKWYDVNAQKNTDESPQEIQRKYPFYDELLADLKKTNEEMIEYKNVLLEIAKGKSL